MSHTLLAPQAGCKPRHVTVSQVLVSDTVRQLRRALTEDEVMEWLKGKTSIAGTQISNWMIVLGAIVLILLIYNSMH